MLERFEKYEGADLESARKHNCHLEKVEDLELRSAIKYLQKEHKYKQILVECGPSSTRPYYLSDQNLPSPQQVGDMSSFDVEHWMPFDTLFLSIFYGRIHPSCIGQVFPNLDVIQEKFNIL